MLLWESGSGKEETLFIVVVCVGDGLVNQKRSIMSLLKEGSKKKEEGLGL